MKFSMNLEAAAAQAVPVLTQLLPKAEDIMSAKNSQEDLMNSIGLAVKRR